MSSETNFWRKSSYSGGSENCVEVAATWHKSSYSTSGENCVEVAPAWHKSVHSGDGENCVEVAAAEPAVLIRDSKNPGNGHLSISRPGWRALTHALRGQG
ncbi:DUF397 domain-containing protein [Actinomadura gamaensis]|uniref:DUF397 domain-containing protein n=1 Tax=Actinomadura gamaensis TaxID=1763541 RepID=A0ABV9TQL9_9ACTN